MLDFLELQPIDLAAARITSVCVPVGLLLHAREVIAWPLSAAAILRGLRPAGLALVVHYVFWCGFVIPGLMQPGSSNTGGALVGMYLLFAEPPLCVLLVFVVEITLLFRRVRRQQRGRLRALA